MTPKSLLEFAGAPPAVTHWETAALLLVDPQMEYLTGKLPLVGMLTAVRECALLLDLARAARAPVFYALHHGKPKGSLFDPDDRFVSVIPSLAPTEGETLIVKTLPNSFARTDLHARIAATGSSQLVVAGFATHMCVSSTVRAALDYGYQTTVVADACATRDLRDINEGFVPARAVHAATLAALADRFATVVKSSVDLANKSHRSPEQVNSRISQPTTRKGSTWTSTPNGS